MELNRLDNAIWSINYELLLVVNNIYIDVPRLNIQHWDNDNYSNDNEHDYDKNDKD